MENKLLLKSAYIPKRKTNNPTDWMQYIHAKAREIRYGTHHSVVVKS